MSDMRSERSELTDHPVFKIVSLAVMTLVFGVAFYLFEFVFWFGAFSLYGLILPGVMVLIWELIKHRHFWMVWLGCAAVILGCMRVFDGSGWVTSLMGTLYWLVSFGTCCCLILARSRSSYRNWEREMAAEIREVPIEDPVKDAFLEELFKEEE